MTPALVEHLDRRRGALAGLLARVPADALLVTHRPNIAYLIDFHGTAGVLVARADRLTMVSDARYESVLSSLAAVMPWLEVEIVRPGEGSVDERLVAVLARLGPTRLGFEAASLTYGQHHGLQRRTADAGASVELLPVTDLVEQLRQVKDAWELEVLREAGRRLSDVSKCIIPNALAGVPERQLAALQARPDYPVRHVLQIRQARRRDGHRGRPGPVRSGG